MELIIDFLKNTPADWFLHPIVSFLLYFHLRHIYSWKFAIGFLIIASFGKEFYDFIWGTGFSWRDIFMNYLGLQVAILITWIPIQQKLKVLSHGKG